MGDELLLAQSGTAGSGALFALLGVGLTGIVTLISVLVKHVLDSRTERLRHERQVDSERREHERGIERLHLELAEKRVDTLRAQRVERLARFLAASLTVFTCVRSARTDWKRDQDSERYLDALKRVDVAEAQLALEEVRLVASDPVAELSTRLWSHLRGTRVPQGHSLDLKEWNEWLSRYWEIRKDLIAEFQAEVRDAGSQSPLDR